MTFIPIQSDNSWGLGGKFTLSGNYGSLAYEGSVVRTYEDGKCMVRILELLLTFIPHTHVNRSSKINVKQVRLVATSKPPTDKESWSIVGLAKHHLSVILSPQTPSFLLTKVVLELMNTTFLVRSILVSRLPMASYSGPSEVNSNSALEVTIPMFGNNPPIKLLRHDPLQAAVPVEHNRFAGGIFDESGRLEGGLAFGVERGFEDFGIGDHFF